MKTLEYTDGYKVTTALPLSKLQLLIQSYENKIEALTQRMKRLANVRVSTDLYFSLSAERNTLRAVVADLKGTI